MPPAQTQGEPHTASRPTAVPVIQFTCAIGIVAVFAIDRFVPAVTESSTTYAYVGLAAIALGVGPESIKAFWTHR